MKLVPLHNLFAIKYGNSFDLNVLQVFGKKSGRSVNYVSRTRENNGVSAFVCREDNVTPFEKGLITVAGSGDSVLSSFVQNEPFYTSYHVFVLVPKKEMSELEKLFYCYCIRQNQYKYGFGRQANKTLKFLPVPEQMPEEFANINIQRLNTIKREKINDVVVELITDNWTPFELKKLFKIKGTKTTSLLELEEFGKGRYPYVTTQSTKNGIEDFFDYFTEEGNILAFDSAVSGFCSYQVLSFSASDHVEKLIPKFKLNKYIALFLVTILNQEQYRYNYGRKCSQTRMRKIKIKLPANKGKPDFDFMENYIKSLPFSSSI